MHKLFRLYKIKPPRSLQLTQLFRSDCINLRNCRRYEFVDESGIVKRETEAWNRSRLVMNCQIWVPSAAFKLEAFKSRLHQSESKFGLKVGQSKKKWLSVSLSSLQVKQREPSVFANQGIPPFKAKLLISLTWTCRRAARSG